MYGIMYGNMDGIMDGKRKLGLGLGELYLKHTLCAQQSEWGL